MPSISRSYCWFVRVTAPHSHLEKKVIEMLDTRTVTCWHDIEKMLCLTHVGDKTDKPHIHFVVQLKKELQKQSLDVRLKKLFEVSGSDYSSKVWDGLDAACAYMFHDSDYRIIAQVGYTQDDINRFIDINKKTQAVIAVNKERGAKRVVERLVEKLRGRGGVDREIVFINLMKMIKDGECYEPGDNGVKRWVEEVMLKLTTEETFGDYCRERFLNLYR